MVIAAHALVLCLILRGRKRTLAGAVSVDFGPGESLIVSHDLPVVSQVTECPYLAVVLSLDVGMLRSVVDETEVPPVGRGCASALEVGQTDVRVMEALGRYVAMSRHPAEVRILEPLVLKEIHFRLLHAPHAGTLRDLVRADSAASQIHRAVTAIRKKFRTGVSVPALARTSGMSESAFYRNFQAISGTTPLQYVKAMRLLEAMRLLYGEAAGDGGIDGGDVAAPRASCSIGRRPLRRARGSNPSRSTSRSPTSTHCTRP